MQKLCKLCIALPVCMTFHVYGGKACKEVQKLIKKRIKFKVEKIINKGKMK